MVLADESGGNARKRKRVVEVVSSDDEEVSEEEVEEEEVEEGDVEMTDDSAFLVRSPLTQHS